MHDQFEFDDIYVDPRWEHQYPNTLGGGVLVSQGQVIIENCRITRNLSSGGSAVGGLSSLITMRNTIVDNNIALETGRYGTAVSVNHRFDGYRNPITTITQTTFHSNRHLGGVLGDVGAWVVTNMVPEGWTTTTVANCIFAEQDGIAIEVGTANQRALIAGNLFHDCADVIASSDFVTDGGGNISRDADLGGTASTYTDPHFLDVENGDFTPGFMSAAIDKALSSWSALPFDYAYAPRGYDVARVGGSAPGGAWDIGALENQTAYATGGSIYVDDDAAAGGNGTVGAPFQTISQALAAVALNWGTNIQVAGGTYPEQVLISGGLILRGGFAADFASRNIVGTPSIIDGERIGRAGALVKISGADGTRVDGFTVARGYNANDWGTSDLGGGFFVDCQAEVTSCTITGNTSAARFVEGGGGIYARGIKCRPNCRKLHSPRQQRTSLRSLG